MEPSTRVTSRKYNPRVWVLLAIAALTADVSDRQTQTIPLPPGKPISIEITIGTIRIVGWDRADAEITIERRVPSKDQFTRLPVSVEDTPVRVTVRSLQIDNGTDPAYRADVSMRVPRTALIDRVQVLEGKITVEDFSGTLTADIRRGPIDGKNLAGTLRLEAGIGSVTLTNTRLSANGLLRLRAFNGDVRLSLAERPADARVMALALNGHVKSDIPLRMKDTWGPRWGEATLGKGEPVISIDVVTGQVEIRSP